MTSSDVREQAVQHQKGRHHRDEPFLQAAWRADAN